MTDSPLIPLTAIIAIRRAFWNEMVAFSRATANLHEHEAALERIRPEMQASALKLNTLANYLNKVDPSDQDWPETLNRMAAQFDEQNYRTPFPGNDGLVGPEGVERE